MCTFNCISLCFIMQIQSTDCFAHISYLCTRSLFLFQLNSLLRLIHIQLCLSYTFWFWFWFQIRFSLSSLSLPQVGWMWAVHTKANFPFQFVQIKQMFIHVILILLQQMGELCEGRSRQLWTCGARIWLRHQYERTCWWWFVVKCSFGGFHAQVSRAGDWQVAWKVSKSELSTSVNIKKFTTPLWLLLFYILSWWATAEWRITKESLEKENLKWHIRVENLILYIPSLTSSVIINMSAYHKMRCLAQSNDDYDSRDSRWDSTCGKRIELLISCHRVCLLNAQIKFKFIHHTPTHTHAHSHNQLETLKKKICQKSWQFSIQNFRWSVFFFLIIFLPSTSIIRHGKFSSFLCMYIFTGRAIKRWFVKKPSSKLTKKTLWKTPKMLTHFFSPFFFP